MITTHHEQVTTLLKSHFGDREIVGIEIGTAAADLTKTILRELPNVRLYTVDPWTHDSENLYEAGHPQEELDAIKTHALGALREFQSRVCIIALKSDEAWAHIDEDLDFAWIDGDHMIEAAESDIENSKKKVKKGGILGGHDYATVKVAIDKCFEGQTVHQGADLTWWVIV